MKAAMKEDLESELAAGEQAGMGSEWETPHVPDVAPTNVLRVEDVAKAGERTYPKEVK
jgi:hypothetical protein